jgi:hypothetical protein
VYKNNYWAEKKINPKAGTKLYIMVRVKPADQTGPPEIVLSMPKAVWCL